MLRTPAPLIGALGVMETVEKPEELADFFELFNAPTKREAIKLCKAMTVTDEGLATLIMAARAGLLAPYEYACHFSNHLPKELTFGERERSGLADNGLGSFGPEARRSAVRISQIFKERRLFAAHLFFDTSHRYWHLIYFDQRDRDWRDNHWKVGGPHIHYSRETFVAKPLKEVWRSVRAAPPRPPTSAHIRYIRDEEDE